MPRKKLAVAITLVAALAGGAHAQDPVKVAPEAYKLVLENDHVRVLEVRMKPGAKAPMHSHPGYVVYAFADGKVKFTAPDGKTAEIALKAGDTVWREAESHAVENVGTTEIHVLHVDPKPPAKPAAK